MKNFGKIKKICEENTRISSKVIDEFLIYYAASRNNLEQEMNQRFAAFKHITSKFPIEWINRMKAQYIAHKVFRQDGLIKSFLNHSALKNLSNNERNYLEFQSEHSWKFSFSVIKGNPAEDFYIMEDVFSDQEYLLYSPGVTKTLESQSVILWFNLISFNCSCYQSFGPIGAYMSFEPDDIFFFATELNPDIIDDKELLENLEYNPIPYMMLISGANYPLMMNNKDQIVHALAEYEIENLDTRILASSFKTEYNNGIYRLSLKKWSEPPHFSQAYYDENTKLIQLSSMTDRGFSALIEGLNDYGYDLSADPYIRVNLTMVRTASDILKRKINLLKYENLFSKESSPTEKKNLDKLNKLLNLAIPDINAGRKPDIESLAARAGVDVETARDIISKISKKLKNK